MSRFTLARPTVQSDAATAAQDRAIEAFKQTNGVGFGDAFYEAMQDTIPAMATRHLAELHYESDPAWQPDKKAVDELTDGIDPDLWDAFDDARSQQHAYAIKSRLMYAMERREKLAAAGFAGTAAQIGSAVLDPVTLAAGFASGGASTALNIATKAGRAGRMVQAGLVTGGIFAPIEGYRVSQTPGAGGREFAQGLAGAVALGSLGTELDAASRPIRFGVVGGAAGLSSIAIDLAAASANDNPEQLEGVWLSAMQQLAFAGTMAAMPGARANVAIERLETSARATESIRGWADNVEIRGRQVKALQDATAKLPKPRHTVEPRQGGNTLDEILNGPRQATPDAVVTDIPADAALLRDRQPDADYMPAPPGAKTILDDMLLNPAERADLLREIGVAPPDAPASGPVLTESANQPELPAEFAFQQLANERAAILGLETPFPRLAAELAEYKVLVAQQARAAEAFSNAASNAAKDQYLRDSVEAGGTLTPKGEAYFAESLRIGERMQETLRPLVEQVNEHLEVLSRAEARTEAPPSSPGPFPYDAIPVTAENAGGMSGGLAGDIEVDAEPVVRLPGDFNFNGVHPASPSMTHLRDLPGFGWVPNKANMRVSVGMAEMVSSSADQFVRFAGRLLGSDPIPARDGSPVVFDAYTASRAKHRERMAPYDARAEALYRRYAARIRGEGGTPASRVEFDQSVTRLKRRGTTSVVPEINEAVKLADAEFAFMKGFAERHGVPGFDQFATTDTYVPRIADRAKIDALLGADGSGGRLTEFVARAIMRGADQNGRPIEPQVAIEMASHWLRNANAGWGQYLLADFMEAPGSSKDAGLPSRAKTRLPMDETYSEVMPDGTTLTIEDLLVNDIGSLTDSYVSQASGAAAFAEVGRRLSNEFRPLGEAKGPKIETLADLMTLAQERLKTSNDKTQLSTVKRLEALAKIVLGHPIHDGDPNIAHVVNIVTNIQTARLMGHSTTVNNLAEFAQATWESGATAFLKQLPNVFDFRRASADGLFTHQGLRELQLMGLGVTRSMGRNRTALRTSGMPDIDQGGTSARAGAITLEKADRLSRRGANAMMDVAGLTYVNDAMLQSAGLLVQQKLYDIAVSGKPLTKERLADMGLSEAMGERIFTQIREHAPKVATTGLLGKKSNGLNTAAWTDLEAAAALRRSMTLTVQRQILQGNPTTMSRWMTTPIGKVFIQFRRFMAQSLRAKTLHGLHQRDASILANWTFQAGVAGLLYMGRSWIESIGRDDRDQFLATKLSPHEVMKAGFSRASWSSYIPMMVDTAWGDVLRRGPVFSGSRTTNLQGGAIGGNPSIDWAKSVMGSVGSMQAPFSRDYDFSREDITNIRKALALPNLWGVKQAIDALSRPLPRRSLPIE